MRSATFDELCQQGILEIGDGYRAKNSELGGDGPIFLRSAYLQDHGFVRDMPERFKAINPTLFGSKMSRLGDVVITTKGNSTGRLGVIREEQVGAVYSPHLSYWRSLDAEQLDQRFLVYWAHTDDFKSQLNGMAYSTDMAPYLSLRDQRRLRISYPEISIQRAAVKLLQSLDDKIELNRRMNETLEAMAQAIFRDWFVDFGPTRRKLEGVTDPLIIMGGLVQDTERAQALADLFPAALGDDGLPEGWQAKGLDEIADFLNGLALQKYPATDNSDSLPVIKIAELRSGVTSKSGRASRSVPEKYIVNDGDFLFSWSGSLVAKFWTDGTGALNQHLFKVSSATYPRWFFSQWVQHHMPDFQRIAASKATTMGHIQRSHLSGAMTVCPATPTIGELGRIFAPLVERTVHNELESRTLAATRDLLLPKLMSGEIRLSEAEDLLEAAQ